jgi:hypothetical protein
MERKKSTEPMNASVSAAASGTANQRARGFSEQRQRHEMYQAPSSSAATASVWKSSSRPALCGTAAGGLLPSKGVK